MSDRLSMGKLTSHEMLVDDNIGSFFCGREIVARFANNRKPNPWYYTIAFNNRAEWFDFVRRVNDLNRQLKKADKDSNGFPIFKEDSDE